MSIYVGDSEITDLKIGNVSPSEVYVGDVKVRPNDEGEIYIIDLTESYSNTIPAGDTYPEQ